MGDTACCRQQRTRPYILDSLVETTISRDVLLLSRVDKPALLRQLFRLGCDYSGQILSYQKMLGELQDVGHTVTLAHYERLCGMLDLREQAESGSGTPAIFWTEPTPPTRRRPP